MPVRKIILPASIFMAIMGIIAGVLRYFQLRTGFDAAGLALPGNEYTLMLTLTTVLAVLIFILTALFMRALSHDDTIDELLDHGRNFTTAFLLIGTVFCFVASGFKLVASAVLGPMSGLLIGVMLFVVAVVITKLCKQSILRRPEGTRMGILIMLPVIWCCIWLLNVFSVVASSPVIHQYIYMLLGIISMLLFFFAVAGYVFGRGSIGRMSSAAFAVLFFAPLNIIGELGYAVKTTQQSGQSLFAAFFKLFSDMGRLNAVIFECTMYAFGLCFAMAIIAAVAHCAKTRAKARPTVDNVVINDDEIG